jgi:hypothetical protein
MDLRQSTETNKRHNQLELAFYTRLRDEQIERHADFLEHDATEADKQAHLLAIQHLSEIVALLRDNPEHSIKDTVLDMLVAPTAYDAEIGYE